MPAPRASIIFDADNKALHEATNQNLRDLQNQSREAAALGRQIGNLVSAFVSYQGVQSALRSAKLGEEVINARREFGKYVSDVEAATQALSRAANGTVDNLRLMQLASESFQRGLDFLTVETLFAYAEKVSDRVGRPVEAVFDTLALALAKSESGIGRNATALKKFGLEMDDAAGLVEQMRDKLEQSTDELDDNSDAVAQAEVQWRNFAQNVGQNVRQFLLPALQDASKFMQALTSGSDARQLLDATRFLRPIIPTALDKDTRNAVNTADALVEGLLDKLAKGTANADDFTNALAGISAATEGIQVYQDEFKGLISLLESMRDQRTTKIFTNIDSAQIEQDRELYQELIDEVERQRKVDQDKALADRAAKEQALRDQLQQQRDLKKAEIALGQATYADLGQLLDQQQADNQAFLDSDVQAKIAWMQDSALVYQQDKANAEREAAGKYNTYQRYIDGVLNSEALSQEERYQKALEAVNGALELEQFDMEQRRVLYGQKQQLEQDYRNFVLQNYAEQVQLLQNLFGEPTLQLLDSFFTQSEVKFEEYLKNLVRMLARYALQMGLLRLFGMILGNPLSVAPIPGSPTDFLPGASIPRLPDLTTLPAGTINTITGNNPRNPGQPQINVSLGVDKEQLYVLVKSGQEQYNRTTFSAK